MTCHRYHLESSATEDQADALLDEIFGETVTESAAMKDRPLDTLFASRSHVRILRVLALLGDDVNLTGRDLARRADISHSRTQEVLSQLLETGVVTQYSEATWAIYELNRSSPLAPLVRSLFQHERQLTSP